MCVNSGHYVITITSVLLYLFSEGKQTSIPYGTPFVTKFKIAIQRLGSGHMATLGVISRHES